MRNYLKAILLVLFAVFFVWLLWYLAVPNNASYIHPRGPIALAERNLILTAVYLMLIVVIPVFGLTAFFAWRYRASNTKAQYLPNWEHNLMEEFIWWSIPCVIVAILGVIAWRTSEQYDPFRTLPGNPEIIEVVALDWKWLFIYPEEHIATVNFVEFPANRPVEFHITSDAPMNSFWIPQLGGQIYAMTGMETKLSLVADEPGLYYGSSANISGRGFSGMHFYAGAVSQEEFDSWVKSVSKKTLILDSAAYNELAKPSENDAPRYYGTVQKDLFDAILKKYESSMPMHAKHEQP